MAASSPAAPASKRAPQMRGFAVICGVVALIVLSALLSNLSLGNK